MKHWIKNSCLALICGLAIPSFAQSAADSSKRPSEEDIFGIPVVKTPDAATAKDALGLEKIVRNAFDSGEVRDNPLQIGGLFYQRMTVSKQNDVSTGDSPLSMPMQFDMFFDARPSDRVRGFVDLRLLYDSTRDGYSNPTKGNGPSSLQFSSTSSAPSSISGPSRTPNNPQTVLDQAWLKFDFERSVFVTVGKQHLKWGTSHFWNPTDFLNTQARDPLLPYDLRLGTTMVKFDIPLEAQRMNIYAISLFDNPQPASTLGQLGEALRVEKMLGNVEVGAAAIFRGGVTPVYGLDFSAPLGPFDVYAESAYLTSATSPSYRLRADPTTGADISTLYSSYESKGPVFQASGGINYSFAWRENRQATAGLEYFYNDGGYSDASAYPVLSLLGQFRPFYTGRNYAGFYLNAEGPDSGKHTSYTFSTLSNLSDSSYISRLDFSWQFLTYLTFEAYYDQHFGRKGGEFNFALATPAMTYQGSPVAPIRIPETVFDTGLALRLSF